MTTNTSHTAKKNTKLEVFRRGNGEKHFLLTMAILVEIATLIKNY